MHVYLYVYATGQESGPERFAVSSMTLGGDAATEPCVLLERFGGRDAAVNYATVKGAELGAVVAVLPSAGMVGV